MNYKNSILIIEDEINICNYISKTLTENSYRVSCAHSASEGISLTTSLCPDLIILDLGLPDMDGMNVIEHTRTWSNTPIIVLSARTNEQEKVTALDSGADDYITKPFSTDELLARIRTAIRHSTISSSKSDYSHKDLFISFEKRLVFKDNEPIHLTQIEYKILSLLAKNNGKVMTYDSIMEHVWGPYIDDNNRILRVNMANIRRKIENNPAEPIHIFTEIGIGYRMADSE